MREAFGIKAKEDGEIKEDSSDSSEEEGADKENG